MADSELFKKMRDILDLDTPVKDRVRAALRAGPHVELAVERIVTRAVETHALHCGIPEVERWTQRFLSGEDRSREAAERAVWIAESVADATWAAWAASEAA